MKLQRPRQPPTADMIEVADGESANAAAALTLSCMGAAMVLSCVFFRTGLFRKNVSEVRRVQVWMTLAYLCIAYGLWTFTLHSRLFHTVHNVEERTSILALTLPWIGQMMGLLPFGRFADTHGRKLTVMIGCALLFLACILHMASNTIMFVLSRTLQGGAAALFGVAVVPWIVDRHETNTWGSITDSTFTLLIIADNLSAGVAGIVEGPLVEDEVRPKGMELDETTDMFVLAGGVVFVGAVIVWLKWDQGIQRPCDLSFWQQWTKLPRRDYINFISGAHAFHEVALSAMHAVWLNSMQLHTSAMVMVKPIMHTGLMFSALLVATMFGATLYDVFRTCRVEPLPLMIAVQIIFLGAGIAVVQVSDGGKLPVYIATVVAHVAHGVYMPAFFSIRKQFVYMVTGTGIPAGSNHSFVCGLSLLPRAFLMCGFFALVGASSNIVRVGKWVTMVCGIVGSILFILLLVMYRRSQNALLPKKTPVEVGRLNHFSPMLPNNAPTI